MTTAKSLTFAQRLLEGRRGNGRIPARPGLARAPLSSTQQRIYFLCRLAPSATNWQAQRRLVLRGALEIEPLVAALRTVQERHPILRTRLAFDGDETYPIVVEQTVAPTIHDLDGVAPAERDARIAAIDATHAQSFDLHAEPLLRIDIARIGTEHHRLWFTVHHIACDGWSMRILFRDLDELYSARIAGRAPTLPAIPITYEDYAAWERTRHGTAEHATHLRYWRDQLRGVAGLALPYDAPAPVARTPRGARWYFEVDPALGAKLEHLSTRVDVTPFVVFVAAFKLLLSRYVGGDDICVATPVANRSQRETRDLVGPLFNTILLRTDVAGAETFTDLINREREVVLDGFTHQQVPYDEVAREVRAERGANLFNVLVNSPAGRPAPITIGSLEVEQFRTEIESIETDLSLDFLPQADNRIRAALSYDRDRFSPELIEHIGRQLQRILAWVVESPDRPLAELELLSPAEHAQLAAWNATTRPVEGSLVHELVAAQARRTPDAIAVEDAHQQLTYRELVSRVDRVAGWLAAHGVSRGARVTVAVTRSADMVVAILGVLRAGAAYVPINPEFPDQRRTFMRADAGAALELDDATLAASLASNAEPPRVELDDEDVAYILYTSGSTGLPKGVCVPHRAVSNFLRSMQREPGITASDTLLAVTTLSFDIAGLELYLPLITGAKVVIADRDTVRDGDTLARLLDTAHVTIMQATPATWRLLLATGWRPPAHLAVLCGGEALPADLAAALASARSLWNLYGPTETTIWSTVARVEPDRPISIGRPIDNTTIYILDQHRRMVPIGVAGELYIGGRGVALGYHRRPELTAERFVADPFAPPGARMYRTGDHARWTHDGTLEHLGRLDSQIKLRGFRIELGEIEATLRAQPDVADATALVREDVSGDPRLVAYVVGGHGVAALQAGLAATLPAYMLPSAIVALAALPLTPNGKLDRKALPIPNARAATYVPPRDDLEASLAEVWCETLRVERVGAYDDFFALGGHSLLAIRLLYRVERRFSVKIPLRDLFANSTLGALAERVRHAGGGDDGAVERPMLYASASRRARLPASVRGVFRLNKLTSSDRFARIVWSAWIDGPLDLRSLERALAAMRARHALLRTRFFDDDKLEMLEVLEPADVERVALLERVDLSSLSATEQERADAEFHRSTSFRPLDVGHGEVISVALSQWSATRHRLTVSLHNIVSDADTLTIFVDELCRLWRELAADPDRDPATILPPVALQFHHLADYLERVRESDVGRTQRAFWKANLEGIEPLELPIDVPREQLDTRREANAGVVTSPSGSVAGVIPKELLTVLERIAEDHHATVMSTLVAAMAGYLSQRTSQRDVALITRLSHRHMPGLERALGFLVNPIVLRISTAGTPAFSELIERTHTVVTNAFDHGECDLFELAPYSAFRFCLVYTRTAPAGEGSLRLPDGNVATQAPHPGASGGSQIGYDLLLWLRHHNDRVRLQLAYNQELFREDTAAELLDGFVAYLTAACKDPT